MQPRRLAFTLLATVLGVICALATSELAYRLFLRAKLNSPSPGTLRSSQLNYPVYDRLPVLFDQQYGFAPLPNLTILRAKIRGGRVVRCDKYRTDEMGNSHNRAKSHNPRRLRIAVFGDSFTANIQHDGVTWPDLLARWLQDHLGRAVTVHNFGRDAYGVLQMLDLAAGKVPELEPDLAVIAFISQDLHRQRFWTRQTKIGDDDRFLTLTSPDEAIDPRRARDRGLIEPTIRLAWCEELVRSGTRSDPLLQVLNERAGRYLATQAKPVNVGSLSRSFLFDRLVRRQDLIELKRERSNPRLTLWDFRQDEQFLRQVATLDRSATPYVLVHLPRFEDLETGRYLMNQQQRSLLASLEAATQRQAWRILDESNPPEDPSNLFLLPEDPHPSMAGLRYYSEALGPMLARLKLLPSGPKADLPKRN